VHRDDGGDGDSGDDERRQRAPRGPRTPRSDGGSNRDQHQEGLCDPRQAPQRDCEDKRDDEQ
jgi:hypothetical protein